MKLPEKNTRLILTMLFLLPFGGMQSVGQEFLARADEALFVESGTGWFRADLSGRLDLETYYIDEQPPGLVFENDPWFFNPRLSLFLDATMGDHLYAMVQSRIDKGFDPGSRPDGDVRLDEYFLRYTPLQGPEVNLQVGKFAMVFGEWVHRHLSWENPFVTAPLPYENMTVITDHLAPGAPGGFLGRQNRADVKNAWLPVVWGPVYTSGASVFGTVGRLDYAFEVKNANISSRPYAWDPFRVHWQHPTLGGRIGHRPNASWKYGASFSHGAYLLPQAAGTLPAGTGIGDFNQSTFGFDMSYSWRKLELWSEVIASRFEVPNVGNADSLSYFVEGRYRILPRLFGAVRWNQQFFMDVANTGLDWDQDIYRIDVAATYRWTRHLQTKLQYSFSQQDGPIQQGEQLLAGQVTVKS